MHRRPTFAVLAALCSLALIVAGCGDDDGGEDTAESTTTTAADGATASSGDEGEAAVDCDAYFTVVGLVAGVDDIVSGSHDRQVAADEAKDVAVEALAPAAEGDDDLTAALDVLGQISFQVSGPDDGSATPEDVEAAVTTLDEAWSSECEAPLECPAPETLEAQGLQCDAEGNVTPVDEDTDGGTGGDGSDGSEGGTVPECPAPEVLEAEGFTCDSEGNLTPIDEETEGECPSPEVLEAEGFTCDSEGNLTPIDDTDGAGEDPAPEEEPVECPAPEVLEAEGYTCDSEGNLTPAE